MTDAAADPVAAILAAIKERNEQYITTLALTEHTASGLPCGDVRRLVAAVEAVLKLADKGYQMESHGQPMPWWDIDPTELREAITAALTGEEADRA
jgi:hypothetical protein